MTQLAEVKRALLALRDPVRAANLSWFFQTGKGEYGYGDRFYGITVPQLRNVAHRFRDLGERDIDALLANPFHEARFVALAIRVLQYRTGNPQAKSVIAKWYLRNASHVNNWDLVDSSAPYILGDYFMTHSVAPLFVFARSKHLWRRRIAIVSTLWFIRMHRYDETLRIAEILLSDRHDLIHKAVGWALREVGKKSRPTLEKFLRAHIKHMPRTTLRYAIERFSSAERHAYLKV